MPTATVRIQHNSMQFSDTRTQHAHDAKAIFARARKNDVWMVTGTEAGNTRTNHDLHDALAKEALINDYAGYFHRHGDWVALSKVHFKNRSKAYLGPFIPGTTGRDAAHGAHAPRGITVMWGQTEIGRVAIGCAHFLTKRSIAVSGPNTPLIKGIKAYGAQHGSGRDIAFFNADVNTNDKARDVFAGIAPFTTIADELKEYYATHGTNKHRGAIIDVISSYDADGRVKAKSYDVLDDSDLKLYADHFVLDARYQVSYTA